MSSIQLCGNEWVYCDKHCSECMRNKSATSTSTSVNNYLVCFRRGTMCEYANEYGQCNLTACKKEDMNTADAISVVHCKDCKYLMFSDMYGECSQAHMGIVRPDDFCSYGERKDEEG